MSEPNWPFAFSLAGYQPDEVVSVTKVRDGVWVIATHYAVYLARRRLPEEHPEIMLVAQI